MISLILAVVPLVAYWIAFKAGKFWAQLLVNAVSFFLPDVLPMVDEICMTTVSVAGMVNRNFMPILMKIAYVVIGIALLIAIICVWIVMRVD